MDTFYEKQIVALLQEINKSLVAIIKLMKFIAGELTKVRGNDRE